MNRFTFLLLSVLFFSGGCSENNNVIWISTTASNPWQSNTNVFTGKTGDVNTLEVPVNELLQVIDGFGGCFNELGWEALKSLPANEMERVLTSLFDQEDGTRFNIFRLPIGANDYAVNWYSLNETAGDIEMKNFSLDRDRQRLIPYIKSAQAYNPTIKLWASPWCPPLMDENKQSLCLHLQY